MSKKANLKELVDFDELQSIQDSFAKTVGTSSVVFSPEGEPLTRFSNPTSFCSLIQTTEEGRRRCFQSFMEMSLKALELKEPNILYCFAHGGHFVAPIIINGEHKGTMFAGQFIPQKFSDEQLSEIRRIAEEINIDPELLAKETKGMRVVGEEEVWNYSSLLFQIVVLIARQGAQAAELNRAMNKLQKAHDELEMRVEERTAELTKSNEELKQSEEKYRGLVEDVSNTIQIWETDAKGVYTYVSPSTKWVYGYSPEKVIGKTLFDFMPGEEAKKIKKEFAKIAKQRKTFENLINPAKHRSGKILIMETSGTPVFDENNQFIGYRGTARDITERKKAENALREVQERLAVTLKSIGDGVIATDIEGRITVMNDTAQELTGWKIDEAMGQPSHEILNIVNEETRNPIDDPVVEVLHSGNVVGLGNHSVLIAKDGTEQAIADSGAPITAFDGTTIGVVLVFRDVTEKRKVEEERKALIEKLEENNRTLEERAKELEEAREATLNIAYDLDDARRVAEGATKELEELTQKLDKSNKDLQDFAYIVSHDLKAPVRKVAMFGELLTESLAGKLDENDQENFDFMIKGATRMQQLINDLLTYSRVQTKAKPMERVDLNEVVEDLGEVELAIPLEEAGGAIEVPEPLPCVYADPSQMHQLMQNLIGNGLKYHREGVPPVITIRGEQAGSMVRIEVQDNGIGIEEAYYEKVFGMFQRLHADDKGTGVGLAVCKSIVERHEGEIGVESMPGEGSMFWFTMPGEGRGERGDER